MKSATKSRVIAFSVFTLLCSYQCYSIIYSYYQNPTIIDIHDVTSDLSRNFPSITVCNNNRLSVRKIFERRPEIRKAVLDKYPWLFENRSRLIDASMFNRYRDYLNMTFRVFNLSVQHEIGRTSMNERFNILPDGGRLIKSVKCALSLDQTYHCEHLHRIESIQDRFCVTLAHQGALKYYESHKPTIKAKEDQELDYFHSREVMRILVDFEPEDYGDLKRQMGARITINSNNYVASASDKDFYIERGFLYEFNLDKQETVFFKDCYNYDEHYLNQFKDSIDPRLPLNWQTCIQNCIVKNVMHSSNCWPLTMPYFRNDSLDQDRKARQCSWYREAQYFVVYRDMLLDDDNSTQIGQLFRKDMRIYAKIKRHCRSQCKLSCVLTQYSITKAKSIMPSKIIQALDQTGRARLTNFCCAMISIKYTRYQYNLLKFVTKYNLTDTIGNLGGLLAVWLGISIVSIYHAIMKCIELCKRRRAQRRISTEQIVLKSASRIQGIFHIHNHDC